MCKKFDESVVLYIIFIESVVFMCKKNCCKCSFMCNFTESVVFMCKNFVESVVLCVQYSKLQSVKRCVCKAVYTFSVENTTLLVSHITLRFRE